MGRESGGVRILRPADVRMLIVAGLAALFSVWGLWEGWMRAPIEAELKLSQKIFYFHAPLGMWTILATCVAAGAAVVYLWKRHEAADLLCESCMEVVLVSCGIVLVTGMLWAKPAWGDWFPWGEPRVTTMLVLFLIAMAYVVLRGSIDEPSRRARYSSVLALVGALDAVIAYLAIHLWQTTHPRVIRADGIALQEDMKRAFLICVVAMGLWTWVVISARMRMARLRASLEHLEHEADAVL